MLYVFEEQSLVYLSALCQKFACVTHQCYMYGMKSYHLFFLEWFHYSAGCCQKEPLGMNEQKEPSDILKGKMATADVYVG